MHAQYILMFQFYTREYYTCMCTNIYNVISYYLYCYIFLSPVSPSVLLLLLKGLVVDMAARSVVLHTLQLLVLWDRMQLAG